LEFTKVFNTPLSTMGADDDCQCLRLRQAGVREECSVGIVCQKTEGRQQVKVPSQNMHEQVTTIEDIKHARIISFPPVFCTRSKCAHADNSNQSISESGRQNK
jgi:hypothetical protein